MLNVNFQISPWHSLRTLVPTVFFPLFILKAFTIPPWWSNIQTSQLYDISYFNFFSSTPFQSSISVVPPGMALPPKPESTLRTTHFSTCPTPYTIWIYPSTFPRPLIHQPSYLFSKASMSLWTSLPSLPRKDSMGSGTSMTVTSALNSPIPLIFHHTYPANPHPQINPTISICYSCL